jgi:hypothetical protein
VTEYLLISTSLMAAVVLVVFLIRRGPADRVSSTELLTLEAGLVEMLPDRDSAELLRRLFSSEDDQFIAGCSDRGLARLFRKERTRLALHWIARNKLWAATIMRRHREASRAATDIQVAAELRLFLSYLRLVCTCDLLSLFVWTFGPERFRELAGQTNAIHQGMRVLRDLEGRSAHRAST